MQKPKPPLEPVTDSFYPGYHVQLSTTITRDTKNKMPRKETEKASKTDSYMVEVKELSDQGLKIILFCFILNVGESRL